MANVSQTRHRGWTFTLNNPTDEDLAALQALKTRRLFAARETGAAGTEHLQGYAVFHDQMRLQTLKKKLPRAHLEPVISVLRSDLYCRKGSQSKEEWAAEHEHGPTYGKDLCVVLETGTPPSTKRKIGEVERERWSTAFQLAKAGKIDDIEPDILLRYWGNIQRIAASYPPEQERLKVLDNHWFYGETGTGKSFTARQLYPKAYLKRPNKWWDGYQGEDDVIIEELSPDHKVTLPALKEWSDHYPFPAETKGGYRKLRPKRIIVCSNYTICQVCQDDAGLVGPLSRRFKVRYFPTEEEKAKKAAGQVEESPAQTPDIPDTRPYNAATRASMMASDY